MAGLKTGSANSNAAWPTRCRSPRNRGTLSAAESYHQSPRSHFGLRERHATFQWIKNQSNATLQNMKRADRRLVRAAWRGAVQAWLLRHDLITLTRNQQVLPH